MNQDGWNDRIEVIIMTNYGHGQARSSENGSVVHECKEPGRALTVPQPTRYKEELAVGSGCWALTEDQKVVHSWRLLQSGANARSMKLGSSETERADPGFPQQMPKPAEVWQRRAGRSRVETAGAEAVSD